jgi:hypothetical protein
MFKIYDEQDVPRSYKADNQIEYMAVQQQYVPVQQQQHVPEIYVDSQQQPGRFNSFIRGNFHGRRLLFIFFIYRPTDRGTQR